MVRRPRPFCWTFWQRCTMMRFSRMLGYYLVGGFNDCNGQLMNLRGPQVTPDLSIQEMSRYCTTFNKPQSIYAVGLLSFFGVVLFILDLISGFFSFATLMYLQADTSIPWVLEYSREIVLQYETVR